MLCSLTHMCFEVVPRGQPAQHLAQASLVKLPSSQLDAHRHIVATAVAVESQAVVVLACSSQKFRANSLTRVATSWKAVQVQPGGVRFSSGRHAFCFAELSFGKAVLLRTERSETNQPIATCKGQFAGLLGRCSHTLALLQNQRCLKAFFTLPCLRTLRVLSER